MANNSMLTWVQRRSLAIRMTFFVSMMISVLLLIFGIAAFIYYVNVDNYPRSEVTAILPEEVTVSEFVTWEDNDIYPAALAVTTDGILYTGSYKTGTVFVVDANGTPQEIPTTRDRIGSVVGLDTATDGTIYVLDHIDPLISDGAVVWRISGETVEQVLAFATNPQVVAPNDIAVDAAGNIYLVDLGLERVLRIAADTGEATVWWRSPVSSADPAPSALAYDPTTDSLLIGDITLNTIYRVPVSAENTRAATEIVYEHTRTSDTPGINGLDVGANGTLYIAALDMNRVGRLQGSEIIYLAGNFRGSSDVAADDTHQRLLVTNWDQRWLQPVNFVLVDFMVDARLPFSIDAVTFRGE